MTPPVFLDNGGWLHALAPKSTKPLHILAIGSSSTAGTGASSASLTYPAQLRADLADIWNIDAVVENAGIGGERGPATLGRLEAELRVKPLDLVIWQVGTNDATSTETETTFRSVVERGVGAAHDAKVDMILLDPQFYPGIKDLPRYERFVGIIGAVGAEQHVPLFSRYAMMKTWGEQSRDVLAGMLAKDRFHMSDRGYGCMAQRLASDMAQRWGRPLEVVSRPGGAVHGKTAAGPGAPQESSLKIPAVAPSVPGAT